MNNKLLIIGPLNNKKKPYRTGGAIVLFENLLTELDIIESNYIVIDTNKENYSNIFFAYLSIVYQLFIKQYSATHLSLHSSRDYVVIAPFIILIGKVFRKKTSLRKFGGEAWTSYTESKGFRRFLLRNIFKRVDCLFLEMKFLVENFKKINSNTYWFPNVRPSPSLKIEKRIFSRRFVFISHVKQSKGIDEIVELRKLLDSSYIIDIYGIIFDKKYSEAYFREHNISYKGVLIPEEVLSKLATYDVLLLPTTWKSEGYPGIIIEAYSLGKPVIATNLQGISEIVDDYKSGILIQQNNVESLKNAVEYFNLDNYDQLSIYAKEKFGLFDSRKQSQLFFDTLVNN